METISSVNAHEFRWREADAYLFDIDGTLLLSPDRTHRYAMERALLDVFGVETTIDGIAYHGKTDPGIVRALLERAHIANHVVDLKMPEALEVMRRDAAAKTERFRPHVLPGVRQVLELLRGESKLLGVASGNLESIGWTKLRAAGLREFFEFGCFADDCELRADVFQKAVGEVRRRLGTHASLCFVGDTPDDVRAARTVGGRVIAVGTGIFKLEELEAHGADATVVNCERLLTL